MTSAFQSDFEEKLRRAVEEKHPLAWWQQHLHQNLPQVQQTLDAINGAVGKMPGCGGVRFSCHFDLGPRVRFADHVWVEIGEGEPREMRETFRFELNRNGCWGSIKFPAKDEDQDVAKLLNDIQEFALKQVDWILKSRSR